MSYSIDRSSIQLMKLCHTPSINRAFDSINHVILHQPSTPDAYVNVAPCFGKDGKSRVDKTSVGCMSSRRPPGRVVSPSVSIDSLVEKYSYWRTIPRTTREQFPPCIHVQIFARNFTTVYRTPYLSSTRSPSLAACYLRLYTLLYVRRCPRLSPLTIFLFVCFPSFHFSVLVLSFLRYRFLHLSPVTLGCSMNVRLSCILGWLCSLGK